MTKKTVLEHNLDQHWYCLFNIFVLAAFVTSSMGWLASARSEIRVSHAFIYMLYNGWGAARTFYRPREDVILKQFWG